MRLLSIPYSRLFSGKPKFLRLELARVKARENQIEIGAREPNGPLLLEVWELKAPFRKLLVKQAESTAIVEQNLHPIALLVVEDEQMPGENRFCELLTDQCRESVVGLAHIGWLRSEKDLHGFGQKHQRSKFLRNSARYAGEGHS